MQKKRHTFEYLRTINHLRARGNAGGALLRVRHAARQGLQDYFAVNKNETFSLFHPFNKVYIK